MPRGLGLFELAGSSAALSSRYFPGYFALFSSLSAFCCGGAPGALAFAEKSERTWTDPDFLPGREFMDPELEKEIERLRQSKVKALQKRYRELFGEDSPSSNRAHLFRRVAWRLPARESGELSERAQQRAAELADDAELGGVLRAGFGILCRIKRPQRTATRDCRRLAAGSRARIGNGPSKCRCWRLGLNITARSIRR